MALRVKCVRGRGCTDAPARDRVLRCSPSASVSLPSPGFSPPSPARTQPHPNDDLRTARTRRFRSSQTYYVETIVHSQGVKGLHSFHPQPPDFTRSWITPSRTHAHLHAARHLITLHFQGLPSFRNRWIACTLPSYTRNHHGLRLR